MFNKLSPEAHIISNTIFNLFEIFSQIPLYKFNFLLKMLIYPFDYY